MSKKVRIFSFAILFCLTIALGINLRLMDNKKDTKNIKELQATLKQLNIKTSPVDVIKPSKPDNNDSFIVLAQNQNAIAASVKLAAEKAAKQMSMESYYVVNADLLNVRKEASDTSEVLGQYKNNQIVTVVDNWTNPKWFRTKDGYVSSDFLLLSDEKPKESGKMIPLSRGGGVMGVVNRTMSVYDKSNLSRDNVSRLVQGTNLQGIEDAVLDVENTYGVNAFFTVAVSKLESGNGYSKLAKNKNNLYGLNATGNDVYENAFSFDSKDQCVRFFGKMIKNNYVNKGLNTVDKINDIYCPSNSEWSSMVKQIMKEDMRKVN